MPRQVDQREQQIAGFGSEFDDVAEREYVLLFSHAGVEHHLQQEVTELVAQIVEIATRNGVSDLISFLDGVGRYRRKILLEVPRAAAAGRAQLRHDVEQAGNIAGGAHGVVPKSRRAGLYGATGVP